MPNLGGPAAAGGRPQVTKPLSVLFIRRVQVFRGHHLKVFNYMSHAASVPWLRPRAFIGPRSDEAILARHLPPEIERVDVVTPADIYFVSGLDWNALDNRGIDTSEAPVIHLVQHFYPADPADPRFQFLARPALRICIGPEVADAVAPLANGPVVTIPNCVEVDDAFDADISPGLRVFIGGLKNPDGARACAAILSAQGVEVDLCDAPVPRPEYLKRMRACEVSLLLPDPIEGFYLPALEAMALGSAAVVPDCVGNRSFCVDASNCLMPAYEPPAMAAAAIRLLRDEELRGRLKRGGKATGADYSLQRERVQALQAFRRVVEWRGSR